MLASSLGSVCRRAILQGDSVLFITPDPCSPAKLYSPHVRKEMGALFVVASAGRHDYILLLDAHMVSFFLCYRA